MKNKFLVNLLIITILTPAIPASSSAALLDEITGFNLGTLKRLVIEPKPLDLAKEGNNKITGRRQYIEDDEDEEIVADEFDIPEGAAHNAGINNELAAKEKAEGAVTDLTEKVRLATEEANRAKVAYDAISTLKHPIDKLRAKGVFYEAQKKAKDIDQKLTKAITEVNRLNQIQAAAEAEKARLDRAKVAEAEFKRARAEDAAKQQAILDRMFQRAEVEEEDNDDEWGLDDDEIAKAREEKAQEAARKAEIAAETVAKNKKALIEEVLHSKEGARKEEALIKAMAAGIAEEEIEQARLDKLEMKRRFTEEAENKRRAALEEARAAAEEEARAAEEAARAGAEVADLPPPPPPFVEGFGPDGLPLPLDPAFDAPAFAPVADLPPPPPPADEVAARLAAEEAARAAAGADVAAAGADVADLLPPPPPAEELEARLAAADEVAARLAAEEAARAAAGADVAAAGADVADLLPPPPPAEELEARLAAADEVAARLAAEEAARAAAGADVAAAGADVADLLPPPPPAEELEARLAAADEVAARLAAEEAARAAAGAEVAGADVAGAGAEVEEAILVEEAAPIEVAHHVAEEAHLAPAGAAPAAEDLGIAEARLAAEEEASRAAAVEENRLAEEKATKDAAILTNAISDLKSKSLSISEDISAIVLDKSTNISNNASVATNDAATASMNPDEKALMYLIQEVTLTPEERSDKAQKLVSQIASHSEMNAAIDSMSNSIANSISDRLTFLNTTPAVGVAAGDEDAGKRLDVWVRGLYGVTSQSSKVTAPGYKGKLAGGTIGLDLEINDRFILGAAYSNLSSKFNYSNNRTGDKTSIGSHAFSIYSQSTINDIIIWKNVASVIISDVTTKYGRGNAIAAGKFRNNTLSLKTEFGYKLSKDNLIIIPNIGLRYTASKDGSYTENGAGIYNIHKSARSSQSIDATIGASLITTYAAGNNIDITPILNASIERNLTNKSQKVRAKFTWMDNHFDNTLKNGKSAEISYNVGGGLTVKKGNIEVSTDYNCNLKKGYASHQGSLKLKVMF